MMMVMVMKLSLLLTLLSMMVMICASTERRLDTLSGGVTSCCGVTETNALMTCVNASADGNRRKVEHDIAAGGGPSLAVGIVTYSTSSIFDYSSYSFAVNEAYAQHNGYIMKLFDDSISGDDDVYEKEDPRWNKVKILEIAIDPDTG